MNTKYTIKNFRVFDSDGATFELNPITILTGCNSSGKSSLVKSLMLLGDYFRRVRDDYNNGRPCHLQNYKLDFSKADLDLGNFKKALNFKAKKDSKITFSYIVGSLLLGEDLTVELSFKADKVDELNNGWLSDISISKSDGLVLYAAEVNNENELEIQTLNLDCIKDTFIDFTAIASYLYANQERSPFSYYFGEDNPILMKTINEMEELLKNINPVLISNCINWFLESNYYYKDEYIKICDNSQRKIIKDLYENRNFFYMPVFSWICNTPKKDIRNVLQTIIIENELDEKLKEYGYLGELLSSNINKIVDEFEISGFDDFIDFFMSYTKETFLRKEKIHGNNFIEEFVNETTIIDSMDCMYRTLPILSHDEFEKPSKITKSNLFFNKMYVVLMVLSCMVDKDFDKTTHTGDYIYGDEKYFHPQYNMFQKFVSAILEEMLIKSTKELLNIKYVGTSIAHVQRLYTYNQHDGFNNLLKQYFEDKRLYIKTRNNENYPLRGDKDEFGNFITKFSQMSTEQLNNFYKNPLGGAIRIYKYEADTFLNYWINKFNIGEKIEIVPLEEGSGIVVYLYKNGEKYLLAEEGYGITQLLSFLIQIEIGILEAPRLDILKDGNKFMELIATGTRLFNHLLYYEPTTVSIEEPENHLHPAFQSKLADMLLDAYQNYNISFIVETHSEYLIRKLQTLVAKKQVSSKDISLYYLYDPDESKRPNHVPQLKKIEIQEDGCLSEPFGSGFFDEADNLSMELLTIKANPTWQN